MIIGIAGFPELTHNYTEAVLLASGRSPGSSRPPAAASPFLRHIQQQQCRLTVETEVSLSPGHAARWDALILPGGGDIDPALLSGNPPPDPHCRDIDPALDRAQLALLRLFVQKGKPVLGICKGMQLICLFFGGGLIQHLPDAEAHRYKECDQFHPTHAAPGSFLFDLYGGRFTVNSAHHQGILIPPDASAPGCTAPPAPAPASPVPVPASPVPAPASPASAPAPPASASETLPASGSTTFPLSVIQTSDDGVPEGLIHKTLPILGLQWHPERLCGRFARQDAADGSLVFQYFLSLIR